MKKFKFIAAVFLALGLCACTAADTGDGSQAQDASVTSGTSVGVYRNINAQEAKQIMDSESGYIILDVRTAEEYAQGHIPGAILIPDYELNERAAQELPDKNQLLLIYCRSGRRSKLAAQTLVEAGYTNILEFGGINDWPYEITQ